MPGLDALDWTASHSDPMGAIHVHVDDCFMHHVWP
jgi:hypothetical protein